MTPAARAQAAIEILARLDGTDQPLDRFLRDWFRARRYAGSKDRRAISERVFAIERRRASLGHRMASDTPRALVIAALLAEGENPEMLFTGDGYGPSALTDAERRRIASPPDDPPLWVLGEFPPFLESELARAFGDRLLDEMAAFLSRAPADLRVNTIKAARNEVLAALMDKSLAARPTPWSPLGVRIPPGDGGGLTRDPLFASGAFEFQDESAQITSLLCAARPGMRVLDLAAGAGGKSLALAATMDNRGKIVAADPRAAALEQLGFRARRAGVTIIETHVSNGAPPDGPFDLVLIDAPCSGSGTWRRQPELKWRITPNRIAELVRLQDRLLDEAALRVGPQATLVYATCSILPCENEDRIAEFLARNPGFSVAEAAPAWEAAVGSAVPPGMTRFFRASPLITATDGFFSALLRRT